MKSGQPKQFIELEGVPVIVRTLKRFVNYNPALRIIVSVHKDYKEHLEELIGKFDLKRYHIQITFGGETRFASVKNGLNLIENLGGVIGIHDAARPFVSEQTIRNCYETAALKGSAIPCVAVNESMRKVTENKNSSVNRSDYRIIQTPQCFHAAKIKKAFEQDYDPSFTDDATVLESTGETVVLVEGNEENIKITSPHDLLIAKALIIQ